MCLQELVRRIYSLREVHRESHFVDKIITTLGAPARALRRLWATIGFANVAPVPAAIPTAAAPIAEMLENRGVKFQGSWGLTVATLLSLRNACQRVCDQLAPQVSFAPESGHYSTHGAKPTRGCLQRLSHSAIGLGIFLEGIGPFLANTAVAIEKK